jgi:hypothetical protein
MVDDMGDALAAPLRRLPYHVGIATNDLEEACERFGALFGVGWSPVLEDEGELRAVGAYGGRTRVVHSRGGPMRIELIEGTASVWATTELASLHHYAYYSADVPADVSALVAEGWEIELAVVDEQGRPSAVAFLVKPGHTRVELVDERVRADYEAVVGVPMPTDVASSV